MEDAGFSPLRSSSPGAMESGNRLLLLVRELERKLCSLSRALDARDAGELRRLAAGIAEAAHEDLDCGLIGLDDEDDGLLDEMQFSSITERTEDLVAFCRAAMDDAAQTAQDDRVAELLDDATPDDLCDDGFGFGPQRERDDS